MLNALAFAMVAYPRPIHPYELHRHLAGFCCVARLNKAGKMVGEPRKVRLPKCLLRRSKR